MASTPENAARLKNPTVSIHFAQQMNLKEAFTLREKTRKILGDQSATFVDFSSTFSQAIEGALKRATHLRAQTLWEDVDSRVDLTHEELVKVLEAVKSTAE
jgi:hypothetical protein